MVGRICEIGRFKTWSREWKSGPDKSRSH